jgi:hypothetical protein
MSWMDVPMNKMFLSDRADGVKGHYCISRMKEDNRTVEHFNKGEWNAFGEVFTEEDLAAAMIENISAAATAKADADWPGKRAQKLGVVLGEIGCPHCGITCHGALSPTCGICDKPYWSPEEYKL